MIKKQKDERLLETSNGWFRDMGRIFEIIWDFSKGFHKLRKIGPCVTVFGSARFKENSQFYNLAREVGKRLGQENLAVMTGGGPGIMEAANRGAYEVDATSIGCNIILPHEQTLNPYTNIKISFDYFFIRKVMLVKYSKAFILMPGGFGTLDEMFETLTLIQTNSIKNFPVIAVGSEYWKELSPFIEKTMLKHGTIDRNDMNLFTVTDDLDEMMEIICSC